VTAAVLGGLNMGSVRYDMADCYLRLIRRGRLGLERRITYVSSILIGMRERLSLHRLGLDI
jgi:hypothetical protein